MGLYLFGCEAINNRLFLKFATYTDKLETSIHPLSELMNGTVKADNVQISNGTVSVSGNIAHNTQELIQVINKRPVLEIAALPDGRKVMLNIAGHIEYKEGLRVDKASGSIPKPESRPTQTPSQANVQAMLNDLYLQDNKYVCEFRTMTGKRNVRFNDPQSLLSTLGHPYKNEKAYLAPDKDAVVMADKRERSNNYEFFDLTNLRVVGTIVPPTASVPYQREQNLKMVIDDLVNKLNEANNAYYNESTELMSNKEYDELYDKLRELESKTGYVRPDSPTQNVGATPTTTYIKHPEKYATLRTEYEKPGKTDQEYYDAENACIDCMLENFDFTRKVICEEFDPTIRKDIEQILGVSIASHVYEPDDAYEALVEVSKKYFGGKDLLAKLFSRYFDQIDKELGQNTQPIKTIATNYKQGTKIQHENAALSLDKTKSVEDLQKLLLNGNGVLSVKMDGLTVVLTYDGGELKLAATRGNGTIGEVCTQNIINAIGVPTKISYAGKLIVRGEAYINYSDFDVINKALAVDAQFKNPRNLASGTVRTFDNPQIAKARHLRFCAFEIANWQDLRLTTFSSQLECLKQLGFTDIIKHITVTKDNIVAGVEMLTATVKSSNIPADGLVLRLDNLIVGEGLGTTGKFPRHSIAFKWEDAEVESKLLNIEWQVGRTGIITPVAVFEPIDIEGSTVERATLHNLSIMEQVLGRPYVGQRIWVYKANMIIPQIARAEKN